MSHSDLVLLLTYVFHQRSLKYMTLNAAMKLNVQKRACVKQSKFILLCL